MSHTEPLLCVKNIHQVISGQHIVKGISFDAHAHEITVFLGPNGAGKTTLLKSVIGLLPLSSVHSQAVTSSPTTITPAEPSIILNGKALDTLPTHERVTEGLLYVPQHTSLFRQLTVEDNLSLIYDYHPFWKKKDKKAFLKERDTLLEQTDLLKSLHTYARNLSGGQQRKAEVIRALLMHPRALLFDEPFAGVDPKSIYELKKLFTSIAHEGMAVVISDHHVDQLLSIASSVYVIMGGQVVTSGSIKDIISNQHLKERYLGSQFHAEVVERFLR